MAPGDRYQRLHTPPLYKVVVFLKKKLEGLLCTRLWARRLARDREEEGRVARAKKR